MKAVVALAVLVAQASAKVRKVAKRVVALVTPSRAFQALVEAAQAVIEMGIITADRLIDMDMDIIITDGMKEDVVGVDVLEQPKTSDSFLLLPQLMSIPSLCLLLIMSRFKYMIKQHVALETTKDA